MARKNLQAAVAESTSEKSESAKEIRTSYKSMTNIVLDGSHISTQEGRATGEGFAVALLNAAASCKLDNPGATFNADNDMTPFEAIVHLPSGAEAVVSVIFADIQCPRCGAPRNDPHSWCKACNGNVAVDYQAMLDAAKAAAKSKK